MEPVDGVLSGLAPQWWMDRIQIDSDMLSFIIFTSQEIQILWLLLYGIPGYFRSGLGVFFLDSLHPQVSVKKIWAILIAFWISGIDFKFSLFYFLPCCTSVYLPKSVTARPSRVKQQIKNKFSKQKFFK